MEKSKQSSSKVLEFVDLMGPEILFSNSAYYIRNKQDPIKHFFSAILADFKKIRGLGVYNVKLSIVVRKL